MDIKEVKRELASLRRQIRHHSRLYYDLDAPEISDYEFDQLMLRLKAIEKEYPELISPNSPTQLVGGSARREAGLLVAHDVPMLSLEDVFSEAEVRSFIASLEEAAKEHGPEKLEFVVEEKIDGLSLALRYEEGKLVRAVTRGDGVTMGEDVTQNARVITDVVTELKDKPPYLEIRGEVYMTRAAFERVNERQERLGLRSFANPRNCAAGTLRQLDSRITSERGLSLFIFNLQAAKGISFKTHTEAYDFLKKQGVTVIHAYRLCHGADEVWAAIQDIGRSRGDLPYDIDGAVVKLNDLAFREKLGNTAKVPRWAIAYKYPPEEKATVIRRIELSVGRTGRITPTAVFDPIRLCGTKVERATLHNQDFIDKLGICLGDTVLVYKSGEIIPKIRSVDKEKRPKGALVFRIGDTCPVCGAKTGREEGTADIRCTNPACSAQRESHIMNFVSREAMDIKGLGENSLASLIENGFIRTIDDIYRLKDKRSELIAAKIIGKEKNTDKVLQAIEKSKENPPYRLLTGLGIAGIGKTTAKSLLRHFGSINALMAAAKEEIALVKDIGDITAAALSAFFRQPESKELIAKLNDLGLNLSEKTSKTATSQKETPVPIIETGENESLNLFAEGAEEDSAAASEKKAPPLAGLVFVITGKLANLSREEMSDFIENKGGRVTSAISQHTDYLLAGEKAGSKLAKARALGVKVIDEAELYALCDGTMVSL